MGGKNKSTISAATLASQVNKAENRPDELIICFFMDKAINNYFYWELLQKSFQLFDALFTLYTKSRFTMVQQLKYKLFLYTASLCLKVIIETGNFVTKCYGC